jgi:hypothetical protein
MQKSFNESLAEFDSALSTLGNALAEALYLDRIVSALNNFLKRL